MLRPGVPDSSATARSRRFLKTLANSVTQSCGPDKASNAAAWLTDDAPDVLCDCRIAIALINSSGPAP
ncbi:hypothetical protein D3C87_1906400 [compost metagenome]